MSSPYDTEDDLSLRTRRGAEERSAARERSAGFDDSPADREVTLNTGTVLALFFALALICAVFFGFGYSMGRKSAQVPVAAAVVPDASETAASDTASMTADKPSPGSPEAQPIPGYQPQAEDSKPAPAPAAPPSRTSTPDPAAAAKAPTPHPEAATATPTAAHPTVRETPATPPVVRTTPSTPPAAPVAAPSAAGTVYVQIAAVSHQEDADVLRSALARRGYKVVERTDANDRLIHVQIGPFTDRKGAETTRQKLLSDGYNAFLK